MSTTLTPREIVAELDKYIIGQAEAKRMVAVAIRNRWRRQRLSPDLKDEVSPKNIIMMGPTGVGKTEIARRLAKLCGSPFIKVDATKYTEVGYVGRDVESMVRDLMEIGIALVREEEAERVKKNAENAAEERLLDLLLPPTASHAATGNKTSFQASEGSAAIPLPDSPISVEPLREAPATTREKLRAMWRAGRLDDKTVELEVEQASGPQIEMMSMPGMEQMGSQLKDTFSRMFPSKKKKRRFKLDEAYKILVEEESERLIDHDAVTDLAKERVEQGGIIFIDEIDKVASPSQAGRGGADVSREGVQRDLLPIVEGSVVNTKYGMIRTDHVLFIAAGAFHVSKPADLIPELQGRFPLRVELSALGKEEFLRILKEPHNALTIQYAALMETEDVHIDFSPDALEEIAAFAEETNRRTENIGARRLYTIMEKILADLSFEAPEKTGQSLTIDREWVMANLGDVRENADLSRFIL
jgi:ATP-dependent protease HslVU, ATPase subunit